MDVGVPKFGQNQMSAASHPSERTMVCNGMSTYSNLHMPISTLSSFNPEHQFQTGDTSWYLQKISKNTIKCWWCPFFFITPRVSLTLALCSISTMWNLPVHRRRCAELPAGRQRLAHPRGAERWAGAGRHRREELWQSRGHGQVLGMEVHGSSSLLQDFVSSKWLTQQFPGFLVINPSDCDFVTL